MTASQLALPVDVDDQGEIRLYKIALPFLPPSKNVYDNWQPVWKNSAKKKWIKAIDRAVDELCIPKAVPRIGLAATLVFPSHARRDPQNYAQALWHWVPDALQKAGVITDDREGMIDIGPNWGLRFDYDLRRMVPKERRQRTLIALTMSVPPGHS